MAVSNLKSLPITALDTIPYIPVTSGEGGIGYARTVEGYVTTIAADSVGSTYKLVRFPSNAKIKQVNFESEAQGAGAISLAVYYSDSTVDGTPPAVQGLVVPTTGALFFASQINCAAKVSSANQVNQSGNNKINLRNTPIWQALGLASDPGGYFDLVAVVDTTAITTGAALLGASVVFVM